jgi:hypothetical protein
VDLTTPSRSNFRNHMIEPPHGSRSEYLLGICNKIKPRTAVVILTSIALQLAKNENVRPVIALLVTLLQLSLADRSGDRCVRGSDAATML